MARATCCSLTLVTWGMFKEGPGHLSLSRAQEFRGREQQLSLLVTDPSLAPYLRGGGQWCLEKQHLCPDRRKQRTQQAPCLRSQAAVEGQARLSKRRNSLRGGSCLEELSPHKPVHSLLASYLSKQAKGSDSSVSSLITPGLWETGHEFQGTSLDR